MENTKKLASEHTQDDRTTQTEKHNNSKHKNKPKTRSKHVRISSIAGRHIIRRNVRRDNQAMTVMKKHVESATAAETTEYTQKG